MSTSKSPGGRSTPSVSGSHWTTSSAPVARATGLRASRSSIAPRRFGWPGKTAGGVRLAEEDGGDVVAHGALERVEVGRAVGQRDLVDRRLPAGGGRGERL